MAIWRRKLPIPITLRAQFGDAIRIRKAELEDKEMVIRIDEYGRSRRLRRVANQVTVCQPPRLHHGLISCPRTLSLKRSGFVGLAKPRRQRLAHLLR
jgi:hypothetical protein